MATSRKLPVKYKIRLKKGDKVMVRSGKYKGQSGTVLHVHPSDNKVTVEGVNVVKKHVKPTRANTQGGIIEVNKPIWVSKVGMINPETKKPSRIGYRLNQDGSKTRVFKTTGKEIK